MVTIRSNTIILGSVISCEFSKTAVKAIPINVFEVECISPSHEQGVVSVALVLDNGTFKADDTSFEYYRPMTVSAVSPNMINSRSTTIVTLIGENFAGFEPLCFFGDLSAAATFVSSTTAMCLVPTLRISGDLQRWIVSISATYYGVTVAAESAVSLTLFNGLLATLKSKTVRSGAKVLIHMHSSNPFSAAVCVLGSRSLGQADFISSSLSACRLPHTSPGNYTLNLFTEGIPIMNTILHLEIITFMSI